MLLTTGVVASLVVVAGALGVGQDRIQVLARFWARILAGGMGCRLAVSGMENLEPGATYIFASNHASAFDILALLAVLPKNFRWIAKKELFRIPIFGPSLKAAGYIAIDRSDRRAAMHSIMAAAERIQGGASVVIFPEGTRSPDGKLLPFKSGGLMLAQRSGRPVVPVGIVGSNLALPAKSLLVNPGRIEVRIGKPLSDEETAGMDRDQLAELTRLRVLALLGQNEDQPSARAA
jgi:1-acyl-sn-glycerol-3-phosphate acyltransferase